MPSPPTMATMHMSQSTTARIRATILASEQVLRLPSTAEIPGTKQLIVCLIVPKTSRYLRGIRLRSAIVAARVGLF